MISVLLASAVSLTVGLLFGGCSARATDKVIENLTQENTSLHGHIHTSDAILNVMGVVLTVTGTALAATLVALRRKRRK